MGGGCSMHAEMLKTSVSKSEGKHRWRYLGVRRDENMMLIDRWLSVHALMKLQIS